MNKSTNKIKYAIFSKLFEIMMEIVHDNKSSIQNQIKSRENLMFVNYLSVFCKWYKQLFIGIVCIISMVYLIIGIIVISVQSVQTSISAFVVFCITLRMIMTLILIIQFIQSKWQHISKSTHKQITSMTNEDISLLETGNINTMNIMNDFKDTNEITSAQIQYEVSNLSKKSIAVSLLGIIITESIVVVIGAAILFSDNYFYDFNFQNSFLIVYIYGLSQFLFSTMMILLCFVKVGLLFVEDH